jgi:taurine dioxygenase
MNRAPLVATIDDIVHWNWALGGAAGARRRRLNAPPGRQSHARTKDCFNNCKTALEWTCRFRWRDDSTAFWDNRWTRHKAIWDYWPNVRSGYRIQVDGTAAPEAG